MRTKFDKYSTEILELKSTLKKRENLLLDLEKRNKDASNQILELQSNLKDKSNQQAQHQQELNNLKHALDKMAERETTFAMSKQKKPLQTTCESVIIKDLYFQLAKTRANLTDTQNDLLSKTAALELSQIETKETRS